jgi:2-succinyl-5-enolpyruvyl-6-hydroxy-3-cyclohexene-1-carboxylate synthase
MYGFQYYPAKTSEEIETHLEEFFSDSEKPKLLEIFTPRTVNDEVLLEYFNFMKS